MQASTFAVHFEKKWVVLTELAPVSLSGRLLIEPIFQ
jgi:hypothetical protein